MLTMSEVELEDPVENIGGQLGRQTAAKTKDFTGDGTTTSVVLAQGPIAEGVKVVAAGANSALITRGIEKTTEALRPEFESKLKKIYCEVPPSKSSLPPSYSRSISTSGTVGSSKDKSFSDVEVDLERYVVPLSYRYPSSSLKVKGMKSKHSIFGQRYVILKNPKGEEMIAEEEACCIHCSAKLAEGDELLKSVCDCTNAFVHLTCADTGTRKEGNICNYCEQEIHNEAVTLHRVITATPEINKENNKKGPFCSCLIM